jgi:hypothetical protein
MVNNRGLPGFYEKRGREVRLREEKKEKDETCK